MFYEDCLYDNPFVEPCLYHVTKNPCNRVERISHTHSRIQVNRNAV